MPADLILDFFRMGQKTLKSARPLQLWKNISIRKVIGTIISRPQLQQALIMDILISMARLRAADM